MSDKETGGNAFPDEFNDGMTLRDYFAAKAMQAMIPVWASKDDIWNEEELADWAYEQADAMLRVRKE